MPSKRGTNEESGETVVLSPAAADGSVWIERPLAGSGRRRLKRFRWALNGASSHLKHFRGKEEKQNVLRSSDEQL
jgi:hypothetical protein